MTKNKGFSAVAAIFLIIVVAAVVAAGVYLWQQQKIDDLQKQIELFQEKQDSSQSNATSQTNEPVKTATEDEQAEEEGVDEKTTDESEDDSADENAGMYNYEYVFIGNVVPISSLQKELSQTVSDAIGTESYTGGLAVNDTDSGKIYFATTETNVKGVPQVKLYSFDKSRDKVVELYWEKYGKEFKILGLDGSKLVVFRVEPEFNLNTCEEPWDYPSDIKYLDLENPTAGLEDYSIPKNIMDKHDDYVKQCKNQ